MREILMLDISWDELLTRADIKSINVIENINRFRPIVFLVKTDGTFYETRYALHIIRNLAEDWDTFRLLAAGVKQEVVDALAENFTYPLGGPLRYREMQLEDYLKEQMESKGELLSTTTTTINPTTISESKVAPIEEEE